jgi:hypothetical protein
MARVLVDIAAQPHSRASGNLSSPAHSLTIDKRFEWPRGDRLGAALDILTV